MLKEAHSQMETRSWIVIGLVWLTGCTQPLLSVNQAGTVATPSAAPTFNPNPQNKNSSRRLKLKLTLDTPDDLKVQEGQHVVKGQLLSDRASIRNRLNRERQILRLQMAQLKQAEAATMSTSSMVEQAQVIQAQVAVAQAEAAIDRFKQDSPWTEFAHSVLPITDPKELAAMEARIWQAKGELAIAQAKLAATRAKHKLQQDTSTKEGGIELKVAEIKAKLATLGVRSPYSGTVKKIQWHSQFDQALMVELFISPL
jgi:multidrug efflux pump subunit AcrA (membrane-fusion protein)